VILLASAQDRDTVECFIQDWLTQVPERISALILGWRLEDLLALPVLQKTPGALEVVGAPRAPSARLYAVSQPHVIVWEQGLLQRGEALDAASLERSEPGMRMAELLLSRLTVPIVLVLCRGVQAPSAVLDVGVVDSNSLVILETADGLAVDSCLESASVVPGPQLCASATALAWQLCGSDATACQPSAQDLAMITAIVAHHTTVDFSEYKAPTMLRRIQRRMAVLGLATASQYIARLEQSDGESQLLQHEMLIGVTRFFRDPEAFEAVRTRILPQLVERASEKDPIRIWVAGCSTGEEVYSLAMMVAEALERAGKRMDLRLFATDLDKAALATASAGIYDREQLGRIPPAWLDRYFTAHEHRLQIVDSLRDLVIFAPHNMVRDAPFHRIDLISCRNVLIYLRPEVQQRLLSTFHFALQPQGHLLLGRSEQVGEMASLLHLVDPAEKIYRKIVSKRSPIREEHGSLLVQTWRQAQLEIPARATRVKDSDSLVEAISRSLLHEFILNFIVVDDAFEIHHLSGDQTRFLTLPQGKPSLNLIKMVSPEMAIALSTGIRRSISLNETVIYERVASARGSGSEMRVTIRPFLHRHDFGRLAVVVIEPTGAVDRVTVVPFDVATQSGQRISDLEIELDQTGNSLRAALEELETSNEEMQATNEEVLAANEELQSSNEELQSVNEELHTVNSDCKSKISELTALNDDILNSLTSSSIGTIFLDSRLCVRKFTEPATRQVNLIESDIGRPFEHLTNTIGRPGLAADARRVLTTCQPLQGEVRTSDGRWYAMRIAPYRTGELAFNGVVITFIDSGLFMPSLWSDPAGDLSPATLILVWDADWRLAYVHPRLRRLIGYAQEPEPLPAAIELEGGQDGATDPDAARRSIATGQPWSGSVALRRRHGGILRLPSQLLPVIGADGDLLQVLAMGRIPAGAAEEMRTQGT